MNLEERFKDFATGLLIGVKDDFDGFRMPLMVSLSGVGQSHSNDAVVFSRFSSRSQAPEKI